MANYLAVTACDAAGWKQYGRRMAESFVARWPREVPLRLYTQGLTVSGELASLITSLDLYQAAPWLGQWQEARTPRQRGEVGRKAFRYDARRWSNKVAALGAAIEDVECDVLIWIDADVMTHTEVTTDWLAELFPSEQTMAWLDRDRKYPETSFMMFRPSAFGAIVDLVDLFRDERIFALEQWHDGFALPLLAARRGIKPWSLSGPGRGYHYVFTNSPLATRMDHLKGIAGKSSTRSPKEYRQVPGGGAYWQW